MFPTANSQVYRNEAGEVLGWDNPGYDDSPDLDEYYEQVGQYDDEGDDLDDEQPDDEQPDDEQPDDEQPDDYRDGETPYHITHRDEQYGDDGDLRDHYGDPDERDEDPPEPREPDDDEVSWQEYGRAEAYADGLHESGYGE